MIIQCERIWLYEWLGTDPFYFSKYDGVDILMNALNDRTIELLDIDKAVFFIDTVLKGGLVRKLRNGGEDHMPNTIYGKLQYSYELEFNVPMALTKNIEQMVGKEFSAVGMRRDLSLFAIFGMFTINDITIDNEQQQRVTLTCGYGNFPTFEVNNLNVTEVINIIGEQPPIYTPEDELIGFDYIMDFGLN